MMYNKNLLGRASLTPEFENGVKTFIEWAKGRHRHMNGDKIRRPCQKCKNTKFGTPDEDYFESPSVPQVSEEPTPVSHVEGNYPQWGDEQHMDEAQKMVFYAAGLSYFASSHEDIPDDGTRSCPVDASPSSYCYGGGDPYDYVDRPFFQYSACCKPTFVGQLHPISIGRTTSIWSTENFVRMLGTSLLEGKTHTRRSSRMLSLEEPRNVQLGLCTDGFVPHGGLMWTMNDLSAYGMASEWSTAGVMGCLVCMDDTRAFHLQHDKKACYFDCHRQFLPAHHSYRSNKKAFTKNRIENMVARPGLIGDQIHDRVINISPTVEMSSSLPNGYGTDHKLMKKSIFWDLVHWSTLLIRHNVDAMHIEKNVFDNILNTIMDIKGRTKDNMNACRDLKIMCNRPELELDERRRTLCLKRSIH
ncbi:UNVERIFIED_CONTAM: hypothetical protein Scaly_2519700 [Sesamum calycinum]|uniref:Transposase-associated domain-containing protein n=1 Tax=Sesamum calycinum TaxID=2727403 RepID=A0AAW2LTS1_9LAMI